MPPAFQVPKDLVDEFKKSGEFDRLRRQLLTHFANSDEVRPLMARVEEIAKEKLSSDVRLEHKTREAVHSEVMQELERYPIIERAVSEVAVLKDEALLTSIEEYLRNIIQGESNDATKLWNAQLSRSKTGDENDDSSDYSEDEGAEDDMLIVKPHTVAAGSTSDSNTNLQDGSKPLLRGSSDINDKDNDAAMDVDESKSSDKLEASIPENSMAADVHPDKNPLELKIAPNSSPSVSVDRSRDTTTSRANKPLKSPQHNPYKSPRSSSRAGEGSPRSITRSPTPRTP